MKSSIHWFTKNSVAANLCMLCILFLGIATLPDIRKELIPNVSLERINIQSELPGASSETVEANLCKPLENRIYDIQGTLDLTSHAYQGLCSITLDVDEGFDTKRVVEEVKSRLDSDDLLPEDASEPEVNELKVRNRVMKLIISGNTGYASLAQTARRIRNDLLESPTISIIDLEDTTESEIRIQIPSHNLEKYQLNFSEITQLIRRQSAFLPGGAIETTQGDILISADGTRDDVDSYRELIVLSDDDGGEIRLGDIARIEDTRFSNTSEASFDGAPAVSMDIYRVGNQNIMDIASVVNQYIDNNSLPDNISIHVWQDDSRQFKNRIDLLVSNAALGLLLLFVVLLLFLSAQLSFWVSVGIPIAFLGAISTLPLFDVSINIISLFAFILVLGIVVDDAVVVGESVHLQNQRGRYGAEGAYAGAEQVYKPILFAVITSIIAFSPLINLPGPEGKLMAAIPIVVISTLMFSLLESFYILPAHLSTIQPKLIAEDNWLSHWQKRFSDGLHDFTTQYYKPLLLASLKHKGLVTLAFSLVFVLFMLMINQGWIRSVLFSAIEADTIVASVTFPSGSPRHKTEAAIAQLRASAEALEAEYQNDGESVVGHLYTVLGPKTKISNLATEKDRDHIAEVTIELANKGNRHISAQDIMQRWRQLTGEITGVSQLSYNASLNPAKPDIQIEFSGYDLTELNKAAHELERLLANYQGTYEIRSSQELSKQQADIQLKDNASALGLTLDQVLRQVNNAFQGTVVQRVQTDDDELDIRLSLPTSERASAWHLENLHIEYAPRKYVSLSTVADIRYVPSHGHIKRYERKRVVTVSAYVDPAQNSVVQIQQDLKSGPLDNIVSDYSEIRWDDGGHQRAVQYFMEILTKQYLLAIVGMYVTMAMLFRSYSQPLLVLFAIPFGILGSVIGHIVLGMELTLWSFAGMVAVSGVVVNDNLVLMDYINQKREDGIELFSAVCKAGEARFRPILLTSLTTFVGLAPIILENSVQAQFLKPMAVSLAFGVLFATAISLLLVPASYLLLFAAKDKVDAILAREQGII